MDFLKEIGIEDVNWGAFNGDWIRCKGEELVSHSPIDGKPIARVIQAEAADYEDVMHRAHEAFMQWRQIPAPKRGDVVRQLGLAFRKHKEHLGKLVTLEMGKIVAEGTGEVQEAVDICDFSVGLSRQLYGYTMQSERPRHRMYEHWHPLGCIGVITAFNFPVAVWAWNAMIALVCGDAVVWKPSSLVPLTAIACTKIAAPVLEANGVPPGVLSLVVGRGGTVGNRMVSDARLPLVSFTGSTQMGKAVAEGVARRLGRTILELGGNNAVIVTPSADLALAVRAIVFGAVGTAGQRCTTTRRVIVHESIKDELLDGLVGAYRQVRIGSPLDPATLMGPMVDRPAVELMMKALAEVRAQGGTVVYGGELLQDSEYCSGCYVTPCIAEAENRYSIVQEETFAPILYIITYREFSEALEYHNRVPQGLSSAIFTRDLLEAEEFLSATGSDCGIANVNLGTSGAEIGGAFGGEKETGGGRESGSDAWKGYMRRQTTTINWGKELPLAQGITFGD
jgi:aldehyde dehydrogenase (NAD+)